MGKMLLARGWGRAARWPISSPCVMRTTIGICGRPGPQSRTASSPFPVGTSGR